MPGNEHLTAGECARGQGGVDDGVNRVGKGGFHALLGRS